MNRFCLVWACSLALTMVGVKGGPFREVKTNKTMAQMLAEANKGVSGMTEGGLIMSEYDMLLTPEEYESLYEDNSGNRKRNAIADTRLRWPKAELVWSIQAVSYNPQQVFEIQQAMTEIERYTCVKFRTRAARDKNYVIYTNGGGCSSQLGMKGSAQYLYLSTRGCRYKGLYVHETLHALGVIHEHTRPDRDKYITVNLANVSPDLKSNFQKYDSRKVNLNGVEYELASVMHYETTAFSKNGRETLYPKDRSKEKYIGRVYLKGLSYTDAKNLNAMYKCASHCPSSNKNKCGADGFLDQNCNCICRDGSMDCDPKRKERNRDTSCVNSHYNSWDCYRWAAEGECENDKKNRRMKTICKRACHVCGKKPQPSGCNDVHPRCLMFKARGDCEVYPDWMNLNCRKTCNFCNGIKASRPENSCGNTYGKDDKCDGWALDGQCKLNPVWMSKNCAKSCNTCKLSCTNKHSNNAECDDWASKGRQECHRNPTWMPFNCARSCNTCELV